MKIGALDLSTHTGHAAGASDGEPVYGTLHLPKTGDDIGAFLLPFNQWIRDWIAVHALELIVFEAPLLTRGKTTPSTARKLMGLATFTEFVCADLSIRCSETNISSVKLFFAGSGRADKSDMMHVARKYGWSPRDDNQGDALGIWASAVHSYVPGHAHRFSLGPIGAKAPVMFGERAEAT